ncbi:hypothetical protein HAX54_001457 [Datura stramonium]|uniref:Uncharacterized protein n=1 Tax=Datura stramonium TaxID=4076 RepID=A0ABS8WSW3_DATST|nr:hypothetical protein [Datura stramonium]
MAIIDMRRVDIDWLLAIDLKESAMQIAILYCAHDLAIKKALQLLRDSLHITRKAVLVGLNSIEDRVTHVGRGLGQTKVMCLRENLKEIRAVVMELQAKGPLIKDIKIEWSTDDITQPFANLLGPPPKASPTKFFASRVTPNKGSPPELHQSKLLLQVLHH